MLSMKTLCQIQQPTVVMAIQESPPLQVSFSNSTFGTWMLMGLGALGKSLAARRRRSMKMPAPRKSPGNLRWCGPVAPTAWCVRGQLKK